MNHTNSTASMRLPYFKRTAMLASIVLLALGASRRHPAALARPPQPANGRLLLPLVRALGVVGLDSPTRFAQDEVERASCNAEIRAYADRGDAKGAILSFKRMLGLNIAPNASSYSPIIAAWAKTGRPDKAVEWLRKIGRAHV